MRGLPPNLIGFIQALDYVSDFVLGNAAKILFQNLDGKSSISARKIKGEEVINITRTVAYSLKKLKRTPLIDDLTRRNALKLSARHYGQFLRAIFIQPSEFISAQKVKEYLSPILKSHPLAAQIAAHRSEVAKEMEHRAAVAERKRKSRARIKGNAAETETTRATEIDPKRAAEEKARKEKEREQTDILLSVLKDQHPRKDGNTADIRRQLTWALKKISHEELLKAHKEWALAYNKEYGTELQFCPSLQNWLRDEKWNAPKPKKFNSTEEIQTGINSDMGNYEEPDPNYINNLLKGRLLFKGRLPKADIQHIAQPQPQANECAAETGSADSILKNEINEAQEARDYGIDAIV